MVFYKLSEVPTHSDDKIFKCSSYYWIPAIVIFGLGIAAIVVGAFKGIPGIWHPKDVSTVTAYCFGGFLILLGLLFLGMLKASLKPTNWLLRCSSTGIIIKYRSYLNWRLPADDIVAVGFDYSEIAWVRKVKERRTRLGLGNDGPTTDYITYLDFCLTSADTSELEKYLAAERKRKCNTLYLDYPVEVCDGEVIRVKWSGGIFPNAGKAIKWLGQFVKIAPKESEKLDLTHNYKANPSDEDAKILKLVKSGDKIAAADLTRQIYGCSLTEAVKFVEKLNSGEIRHGAGFFEPK